jgi:hypothetical protein
MATNIKRHPQNLPERVTEAAVKYFRARNRVELHRELHLKPWEWSPLDARDGPQPSLGFGWDAARELRKALEDAR